MKAIIVGGGRVGSQLAKYLLAQSHDARVIENRPDVLTRLHRELPSEQVYEGNPYNPEVLEQAGIRNADVVALCSREDDLNLVICYMAKEVYGVSRTISRVNDPRNAWLFTDEFHVDVAFNQSEIMARLIEEELSMGDVRSMVKIRKGNYSVVEKKVPAEAKLIGIPVKELDIPRNCIIAAVIREGSVDIPNGDAVFGEGDEIIAVTDLEGEQRLAELMTPKEN